MILIKNISKSYQHKGLFFTSQGESKQVIKDISLQINEGETLGLIGINGAGKSTLIKLMLGIIQPDQGEITIDEESARAYSKSTKQKISAMFGQKSQLWWNIPVVDSLDIIANMYGKSLDLNTNKWIKKLDIESFITKAPRFLSFGQRIRCELVATLLSEPKYLFLDEPFIGLDSIFKLKLLETLKSYQKSNNVTMVIASHDLDYLEGLVERIVILDHHTLAADTSLKEIAQKYNTNLKIKVEFAETIQPEQLILFNKIYPIYPEAYLEIQDKCNKQFVLHLKEKNSFQVDFLYDFINQNFNCKSVEFTNSHTIQDLLIEIQFEKLNYQEGLWSELIKSVENVTDFFEKVLLLNTIKKFTKSELINDSIFTYIFEQYQSSDKKYRTFLLSLLPNIYTKLVDGNKDKVWKILLDAIDENDTRHRANAIETSAICLTLEEEDFTQRKQLITELLKIYGVFFTSTDRRLRANSYLAYLKICSTDEYLVTIALLVDDKFLYPSFYYLFEILTLHPPILLLIDLQSEIRKRLLSILQKLLNLWLDNHIKLSTTTVNRILISVKNLKNSRDNDEK